MKLSLDWISEFVDLSGIDAGKLADELTVHTAEIDEILEVRRATGRAVIAKIVSARSLDGSTAKAVQIDAGGEIMSVICAAPNVREGMMTVAALPGAVLATGDKVEPVEMYGVSSQAVLCSAQELGFGSSHEGILELPRGMKPGQPLSELVAPLDTILEVDNKSITNRPDLWSHYGFAREIAAIFGRELRPLETMDLKRFSDLPAFEIGIESADCPYYSAIRFSPGEQRPSPLFIQCRLGAIGSRPRNLLVDLTNYVQFEIGQPTHAFDADRVSSINVANAKEPLEFKSLDGVVRRMVPGDLLIQERNVPIAIAGIIGGASTEVTPATRHALLESATFHGPRVRLTSMRLGIRTDASQRFEKKLPPLFARIAPARLLHLFDRVGAMPEVTSRLSSAGSADESRPAIDLPPGYISVRAGTAIDDSTCKRILESIGFETRIPPEGGLNVAVPPFRSTFDISTREDISEEIMRLYGYDAIEPSLPTARTDSAPLNPIARNQHRARRMLSQSQGFTEIKTYSWYSAEWLNHIGYVTARRTLDLRNPIGADRRSMRDSLVPNLLAVIERNRALSPAFRIFELGKIFWLDEKGDKHESNELCGMLAEQDRAVRPEAIFASLRSAVEDIARVAGSSPLRTEPGETAGAPTSFAPWKRTSATVNILRDGRVIGAMGMVPLALRDRILSRGHIGWFTLNIDSLAGEVYPAVQYTAPPVFPGSTQDFTVVPPSGVNYAAVSSILDRLTADVAFRRSFIGAYQQPGEAVLRYTFRFEIFVPDRTITTEDIDGFRTALVSYLDANGIRLL